jgi:pyridoxal phosphate enzyme (YggS family)
MSHAGLDHVVLGIAAAARAAGRDPAAIHLIAVSKTFGAPDIIPVIESGQRLFGENRVQEAKTKWPALKARHSDLQLHLIGPLQSNKVAEAVALFDAIHTIDRPKIAETVAREMKRQNRVLQLFVQVNTGREPQKAGIAPEDADGFIRQCREVHGLAIDGLMCIPPADQDAKLHFEMLGAIARRNDINSLSMGMSGDFAEAIACGATHVRVGSAIFGQRSPLR